MSFDSVSKTELKLQDPNHFVCLSGKKLWQVWKKYTQEKLKQDATEEIPTNLKGMVLRKQFQRQFTTFRKHC